MKERMKELKDESLLEIVGANRKDYTPEAIAAATQELESRGYCMGVDSNVNSEPLDYLIQDASCSKPNPVEKLENVCAGCMSLKEAIQKTNYLEIEKTLKRDFFSVYEKYNFAQLYLVLLRTKPVVSTSVELRIEKTFIEAINAYSDEEIIAYDSASDEIFNPELSSWPEWLGYSVAVATSDKRIITKFVSMCLVRIAQNNEELNAYEINEGKSLQLEHEEDAEEDDFENSPRPFIRFFARRLDYMLFGSSLGLLYCVTPRTISQLFGITELVSILLILWVFAETMCVFLWGCTPGKYIFSVKIVSADESSLNLIQALKRSIGVLVIGMGLGNAIALPVLNVFGYYKLMKNDTTLWDKFAKTEVMHGPISMRRIILGVLGVIVIMVINIGISTSALANVI